jgi:hypothetical protein
MFAHRLAEILSHLLSIFSASEERKTKKEIAFGDGVVSFFIFVFTFSFFFVFVFLSSSLLSGLEHLCYFGLSCSLCVSPLLLISSFFSFFAFFIIAVSLSRDLLSFARVGVVCQI